MSLDFKAISLSQLTDQDVWALETLTFLWSPPDVGGISSHTMGPEAYRRWRLKKVAISASLYGGAMLVVPAIIIAVVVYRGEAASLREGHGGLLYFLIAAVVLGAGGAVDRWNRTGGKHRTSAGAEPATKLGFAATTNEFVVVDALGYKIAGPWPRWRITNARSRSEYLRGQTLYVLESVELVLLAEDGSSAGSVTLDPLTLTGGRDFSATVLGMIASHGSHI